MNFLDSPVLPPFDEFPVIDAASGIENPEGTLQVMKEMFDEEYQIVDDDDEV